MTVVSCALTCRDSTIRAAITLRSRDIFTVVPRSGETGTVDVLRWAGASDATGAETAGAETGATGAAFGAADCTSSLRIRPPTPVPVTLARFTPSSEASLRTIGVT